MKVEKHGEPKWLLFSATAGDQIWLEEDQAVFQVISYIPVLFGVWSQLVLQLCFKIICY